MKGADIIQIATAVYGLKWFDTLSQELGVNEQQLSEWTKAEEGELPGPVVYAMSDIVTKYMARVESMNLHNQCQELLLSGKIDKAENAAFATGMIKGMALVLSAVHGEADELKELSKSKGLQEILEGYLEFSTH